MDILFIDFIDFFFEGGGVLFILLDLWLVVLGIFWLVGEILGVDVRIVWICG